MCPKWIVVFIVLLASVEPEAVVLEEDGLEVLKQTSNSGGGHHCTMDGLFCVPKNYSK
jgi:hypothetical protein